MCPMGVLARACESTAAFAMIAVCRSEQRSRYHDPNHARSCRGCYGGPPGHCGGMPRMLLWDSLGRRWAPSPSAARVHGRCMSIPSGHTLMCLHVSLHYARFGGTRSGQHLNAPHACAFMIWGGMSRSVLVRLRSGERVAIVDMDGSHADGSAPSVHTHTHTSSKLPSSFTHVSSGLASFVYETCHAYPSNDQLDDAAQAWY